ncbi:MAG: DUF1800 family protein [Saprospiraceae bacterium]|nr:DUF1800 family protein [Saprospiraceae bacterium]
MKNVFKFFMFFLMLNCANAQNTVPKYNGNFGEYQLKHLLRRTLFGATLDDMNYFKGKSMDVVVDELLNVNTVAQLPVWSFQYDNGDSITFKAGQPWLGKPGEKNWTESIIQNNVNYWWHHLMITQDRSIREKMVLFYENHLPSNNGKNNEGQGFYYYNRVKLLRDLSLGNYKELVKKITLDPSMMYYLDLNQSYAYNWYDLRGGKIVPTNPNENFARELQELYTIGKGRNNNDQFFTENDVKAAAKVLSGWNVCNNYDGAIKNFLCNDKVDYKIRYNEKLHAPEDKVFSSFYDNKTIKTKKGPVGGLQEIDEFFDMLFANEESSRNLVRKLYRFFVYAYITDETERDIIVPLSKLLRDGGNGYAPYDVKPVLKALFTSSHFYNKEQIGCMIKNPYDLMVGATRMMGAKIYPLTKVDTVPLSVYLSWKVEDRPNYVAVAAHRQAQYVRGLCFGAGMLVSNVPDVAGFPAYYQGPGYHRLWINADFLRERKKLITNRIGPEISDITGMVRLSNDLSNSGNIQSMVITMYKMFTNQRDVDDFIRQNIDYFFVNDISAEEKNKLKYILETHWIPTSSWLKTCDEYNSGNSNNAIHRRLLAFYDALFSYAEFQLM